MEGNGRWVIYFQHHFETKTLIPLKTTLKNSAFPNLTINLSKFTQRRTKVDKNILKDKRTINLSQCSKQIGECT